MKGNEWQKVKEGTRVEYSKYNTETGAWDGEVVKGKCVKTLERTSRSYYYASRFLADGGNRPEPIHFSLLRYSSN
jgi:hypothetical protein